MEPQVNIVIVVDVIRALSEGTLRDGNLCLVDDGGDASTGQGTPELCTACRPGQVVRWTALPVDVQTPVEIRSITFLDPVSGNGAGTGGNGAGTGGAGADLAASGNPTLAVWAGVVPPYLTPGQPYRYRLDLQMYEGATSVLSIDSPALRVPAVATEAGAVT